MTDPLDFDGEDLQEALSQASASLGIPTESLDYEVVQEARRGFLGVGGRGVRIRVRLSGEGSPDAEPQRGGTSGRAIPSPAGSSEAPRIQAFLEAFVAASPFEITFRVTEDEERICVDLDGPDRELLLERRGEALRVRQVLRKVRSADPLHVGEVGARAEVRPVAGEDDDADRRVLGVLFGIATARGLTAVLDWPTQVSVATIGGAFAIAAAVGIAFGYYPARRASRLDPIQSLRYE